MLEAAPRPQRDPPFILFWSLYLLWLFFFVPPVANALGHPSLRNGLLIFGAACSTALYARTTWDNTRYLRRPLEALEVPISQRWWILVGALISLGFVMGLAGGQTWVEPVIFASAVLSGRLKPRQVIWAIGGLEILNVILCIIAIHDFFAFLQGVFLLPVIAIAVSNLVYAVETNRALRLARQEIARLAVNEERLRFARDLHDLLGHTLSLIAIKSELAGQLIAESPMAARREVSDIETAARTALQDVRAAVAGYRQPTLASEIDGAQEMLTAAGIAVTVQRLPVVLPPPVEALFAWTLREGVTNVLRHSHAHACAISINQEDEVYAISIADDGCGVASDATPAGGNGLRGIQERAATLGGVVQTAASASGGFRLSVRAPRTVTPLIAQEARR